jgi:hypothetical protein
LPQFVHLRSVLLWLDTPADQAHAGDMIKTKLSELGTQDIFRVICSFLYLHSCLEVDIFVKDSIGMLHRKCTSVYWSTMCHGALLRDLGV